MTEGNESVLEARHSIKTPFRPGPVGGYIAVAGRFAGFLLSCDAVWNKQQRNVQSSPPKEATDGPDPRRASSPMQAA